MENGTLGSINLSGGGEPEVVDLSGKIHLLPCSIKFDGPCSVSHYFRPKPTEMEVEGLRVDEAHFRGRKLQGTTISLPEAYSGLVLGKKGLGKRKASNMSEGNKNCWEMNAKFRNITYWKHDSLPSQHDPFLRSFHWFAVAKAMHQPVEAEELVSASIALEKMK
ncbi:hypothetical protein L484_018466 [Morus notabilis]|uniref:Uncharacterized protein n=1 Tax=Morus notabilis TaxID=981085 RepID=W9S3G1_9ROSA|nr:uncharacterized protein C12B10.15c [Morus notabilis]XP_024030167.1 uncharacterized protein C12B10.15c [Morus notabilis]EXC24752.1 hypothetical protein L484_018466 [Morus notabilis]